MSQAKNRHRATTKTTSNPLSATQTTSCRQCITSTTGITVQKLYASINATIISRLDPRHWRSLGRIKFKGSDICYVQQRSILKAVDESFLHCHLHGRHYSSLSLYCNNNIGSSSSCHQPTLEASQKAALIIFLHCNKLQIIIQHIAHNYYVGKSIIMNNKVILLR